jgi:hypothetical protein
MSGIQQGVAIAFVSTGGIPLGASLLPLQLQPHLALGSLGLTVLIATVVALTAVSAFVLQGRAAGNRRRIAIVGGSIYAVVLLSIWAGVRILFWRFAAEFPSDIPFVLPIMMGVGVLFMTQWGGATILYFSYRLHIAGIWLFATTWGTVYAFLFVGGEGTPTFFLILWLIYFGPATLGVLAVLTGTELAVRNRKRLITIVRGITED